MPLGALRPSPLVEQAAEQLREQITSGQWPVGTKLPGETTLAASLGVGRSTVREALRALAGAGLVRARQGAGVFVTADRPDEEWPARLRRAALADIYEVRAVLEVQAARLAADRRTPEDVAALDAALAARAVAARAGGAAFIDADIALHTAVVAAAHNPVLTDVFGQFIPRLREGLLDLLDLMDVSGHDAEHGEAAHRALVEAVTTGDPDRAGEVLRAELRSTQQHVRAGDAAVREAGDAAVREAGDAPGGGTP
ncbi:DNA-binding transcriptional regulator, FadR family [Streptomyces sp. DvalAA-14]|uniref:FadR/GntR family transcriptional regulator n=1 Tax=unclassified Streptomyces TaxID=2593676 RepID=UPI00081B851C|nr:MULTISPECIES: FCD domain-containing protein [unclassified Streptomyces]MYS22921.1 FCD domain-containing protein [Streptomyces sp. SID4948]SCE24542.1 DNA-binding transcriptional regulator, FadR family [Streptomyces sp. DvalAA-14]